MKFRKPSSYKLNFSFHGYYGAIISSYVPINIKFSHNATIGTSIQFFSVPVWNQLFKFCLQSFKQLPFISNNVQMLNIDEVGIFDMGYSDPVDTSCIHGYFWEFPYIPSA